MKGFWHYYWFSKNPSWTWFIYNVFFLALITYWGVEALIEFSWMALYYLVFTGIFARQTYLRFPYWKAEE